MNKLKQIMAAVRTRKTEANARHALNIQGKLRELRNNSDAPKNFGHPVVMAANDTNEVDVYLYDVIGWPWITAMDLINEIPNDAGKINLYINSPGGQVDEGLAIADFFDNHPAFVDVRVTGMAASMASVIFLTGDRRTVPAGRYLMIHKPWSWMVGTDEDLEAEAAVLRKIGDDMAALYAEETGNDLEAVRQWMAATTYFNSEESVQFGFADPLEVIDPSGSTAKKGISHAFIEPDFNLEVYRTSAENNQQRVAMALPNNTINTTDKESNQMNEKLRKVLEAKGLAADATDEQAWDFLAKLDMNTGTEMDIEGIQAAAVAVEQDRQKEIRKMCRVARLDEVFTETLIDSGVSAEEAGRKIFDEMAKTNPPFGPATIESGKTEGEKFGDAARDGLLMRAGVKLDKAAPGASDFRGFEMASIIRESMRRSGADVSRLHSRRAIADAVFNRRYGAHTTSDFPYIFRDAANKTLLKAYTEAPATWRPWVNVISASDFKTIYGMALSEAPDLDLVNESEEYSFGAMAENQESYRVYKYGKILKLTFEMILNDDLRAFVRLPQLLGNAARRKESDLVYTLLTSGSNSHGPTMTDGYQLFKTTVHTNLLQTGRAINSANIDAAIQLMSAQTGLNGSTLDVQPRFLLVGPKNRLDARILMESASNVDDDKNAGVINPMQGEMQAIVETRVGSAHDGLGWYIIGDPGQIDTFEVAYLEGYEQPQITEQEEFTSDTILWKVRQFFGVGAMEYRGMVCNDGTA